MSIVERILRVFLSYAELAQGWNPQEEGDYQDFVDAVGNALAPAEQGGRVDEDKLLRVYKAARGLCHGYDWNKGTAARYHRAELLSAVNDIEPVPDAVAKIEAALAQNAQKKGRCGSERYELDAYIWKRESTQEWVLEISGTINDTTFVDRHTEPLATQPEDVAGLPSLYTHAERARVPDHHQYDVGWKIRGVSAYNAAKAKGFRHPECVEAAIKAAPSQPEDAA